MLAKDTGLPFELEKQMKRREQAFNLLMASELFGEKYCHETSHFDIILLSSPVVFMKNKNW